VGGEATVENLQLRCRGHNAYEAKVFFARPSANEVASVPPWQGGSNGSVGGCAWPVSGGIPQARVRSEVAAQ
jgi:hypothetical protein